MMAADKSWHSGSACMTRLCPILIFLFALCFCGARTVKDELGHAVNVPENPHRIVCLLPSIVDDVYALGAGNEILAVSDFTRFPPEARNKRTVGPPLSPSIETIVALHPDLALADADLNSAETLNQLEKAHVTVFFIEPHGIEGIYASILDLGAALNRELQARALVDRLRARVAAVRLRASGKRSVRLLMPIWYDPVLTIGRRASISEMIQIAGGRSVTDDLPEEWPQISLEAVVARAPEALLLVRGSAVSMDLIRNRPGWKNLPAVRDNRIFYTDDRLESPSPVAFDALEDLARQFYP